MLWIDRSRIEESEAWAAKARVGAAALSSANPDGRKRLLRLRANVWQESKGRLEKLSHGKCWYCDSSQDRSPLAVDHYRPKGPIDDADPAHAGYWWLAFAIENFRLACWHCNSTSRNSEGEVRGKRSHFPLADETLRARSVLDSVDRETPLILDPTVSTDPALLFFDMDGFVRPNPHLCTPGSLKLERAEVTIDLLNLNQPGIRDRRKRLYTRMSRDFKSAASSFEGFIAENTEESLRFTRACESLQECVVDFADLASNARCFLRGWRGQAGIAEGILDVVL